MGFWDSVVTVVGSVPVVGHVTAGVQHLTGDKEGARQSLARSTGNLVSGVGAVGGFFVGGPPGFIAGGGLGAAIGGQINNKINGKDFDLSFGKIGGDVLVGSITGVTGGGDINYQRSNLDKELDPGNEEEERVSQPRPESSRVEDCASAVLQEWSICWRKKEGGGLEWVDEYDSIVAVEDDGKLEFLRDMETEKKDLVVECWECQGFVLDKAV
ncbi:hypothetical protein IL306_008747 [Fusarium sp. DS 682]|nr:hypothetical protein IL306_008747 [Fusarium sp. DS 682]